MAFVRSGNPRIIEAVCRSVAAYEVTVGVRNQEGEVRNQEMDCQGAKAEPEGRAGGPGNLKTARGGSP